jgi:hypothetical protein
MHNTAILMPMLALVAWTMLVLCMIPYVRFVAVRKRLVTTGDFRYGESDKVPPQLCLPNRNYMNLLEMPMLFYVASLTMFVSGTATPTLMALSWAFVGLRVVHSLVHIAYNNVVHRLIAFTLSNFALAAIWILMGKALAASAY